MNRAPLTLQRRSLLSLAGLAGVGALTGGAVSGCTTGAAGEPAAETSPGTVAPAGSGTVLLAYFSRAGWNYHYGGRRFLETGNTEVLAGIINGLIGCDVHRLDAADPYSDDYEQTVERNVREQNADTRPAIANPLATIDKYDTVLLASGIWNIRAPMIMSTFADSYDFSGKMVYPVTTYAMSGLGTTERDYRASCRGAVIGEGLAVQGEEAADSRPAVEAWLRRTGLLQT